MANRWYHLPTLHTPTPGVERKVSWLELFYDLVYVAAIIQLGDALSHHVTVSGFIGFAAVFAPLWYTWTGFTFYENRFRVDDIVHRLLVFGQMFAIGAVAVLVPEVLEGEHTRLVLAYAIARVFLILMYARIWAQVPEARALARQYTRGFVVGAVLWFAAAAMPHAWFPVVAAVAFFVDVFTPLSHSGQELLAKYPPDAAHMTERFGLFTIIVLGESFVKVLSGVAAEGAPLEMLAMGALAMIVTLGLWWIYFDDVAGSRLRAVRLGPIVWVYSHLPLAIGITAVGVAVKKAALLDAGGVAGDKYRYLLCAALALALAATAVIDAVTERRQAELSDRNRVRVRAASALVVGLLALAGGRMPSGAFVGLVALVMVAQVLFDLFAAPERLDDEEHHHEELVVKPRVLAPRMNRARPAVRLGTPDELRRDVYALLMETSWAVLGLQIALVYVMINVVFGALFLLDSEGVHGMSAMGFVDAFSFSVQTFTTIGYGAMYPTSTYAQTLVTVEAALGLLGVALVTGLAFAKVSRPRSGVLFSSVVTVAPHHGRPTLSLRVGNARGTDMVDVVMRVSALVDDVSPEGHVMKRLVDLKLARDHSPIFALTWVVFHDLGDDSPLHGLSPDELAERVTSFVVTLSGHDLTYHQTVHARHFYYPEDLRFGERFVDVVSFLDDGRPRVDYHHFHDTVPIEVVGDTP